MQKLYIVVRRDLAPGAQCAQACHAMSAFADAFPDAHRQWHRDGQNLVVVTVADETELAQLETKARGLALEFAAFHEPDFADEMTAVALAGDARALVSSLPLALRAA